MKGIAWHVDRFWTVYPYVNVIQPFHIRSEYCRRIPAEFCMNNGGILVYCRQNVGGILVYCRQNVGGVPINAFLFTSKYWRSMVEPTLIFRVSLPDTYTATLKGQQRERLIVHSNLSTVCTMKIKDLEYFLFSLIQMQKWSKG